MLNIRRELACILVLSSTILAACGETQVSPAAGGSSQPGTSGGGTTSAIVLQGTPSTSATVGTAYSFVPTIVQSTGTIQFTVQNKPSWASLNATTGQLSGTPQAAETTSGIVITASNGTDTASLPAFTITVQAASGGGTTVALAISGTPAAQATVGVSYSFVPTVTGAGSGTLSFSIQNKPSWASFNVATGQLSGTPQSAGTTSNIIISVSNGTNTVALAAFALPVQAASISLSISGTPATQATVGMNYSFVPTVTGAGSGTLSFSIQNKPSWASFNTTNGQLSGTPQSAGTTSNIIISVSNGTNTVALAAFALQAEAAVTNNPAVTGNAGAPQGLNPTPVCTTALTGSHATYNVGPGLTYTELDTVPFGALVAGDVVNIYARSIPYKAKFGLRAQGTASAPVIINGVSDVSCNKPVLDFAGATTAHGSNPGGGHDVFTSVSHEALGGIVIKRGPTTQDAYGVYEPKWIIIQGLQLQGARNGASFTSLSGATTAYSSAGCIWVQQGEDIVIRNNVITDCGFGIFVMAKDDLLSETSQRLTVANSRVYGHGVSGSYSEHGFYMQAANPIVEGNFIGKNRSGSSGSSYKSRSSGEVFRHNYVICSALCLDLVQSEEQHQGIAVQQDYGTDYVYSNTIDSDGPPVIHYGGDNMGEQDQTATVFIPPVPYRKHLRFWDNTYTLTTTTYKTNVFRLSARETEVDAWNNTFKLNFTGTELAWVQFAGQLRLGPGNVITGVTPSLDAQVGAFAAAYLISHGTPIPVDPLLAQLQ